MDEKRVKFIVSSKEEGMGLLSFLREKRGTVSSVKSIKRTIDSNGCLINGRIQRFSTHHLKAGDRVELSISSSLKIISPTILYEDEDLLICNKPAGLVSSNEEFQKAFKDSTLDLVHRLDKETSGVILLAKNKEIKNELISLFEKKEVQKKYLALVFRRVEKEKGKIESFLSKKNSYQGQSIYGSSPNGEKAITLWKVLKKGKNASLLLCMPITGRTHQIRVHLSEMGHPIIGDFQYGKDVKFPYVSKRHLLHAYELCFMHPRKKIDIKVKAPIPEDFLLAQKKLIGFSQEE